MSPDGAGWVLCALARALAAAGAFIALACSALAASPPSVVVTIKPLHALVAQVMTGVGSPELLVRGAASPHTFALKPSETRLLHGAALFVRMSEAVEPFTARLVRSLPASVEVLTLQEAPRLKLLSRRTEATFEPHSHGSKDHRHGPVDAKGAIDGHAWLDPDNAVAMVDRIAERLSAKDPANAAAYRANAAALNTRLTALSEELARDLKPIASRPYIVFHDAYQYLERRYGLNVVGSIFVSPDVPASAKRLRQLRSKITALGAVCVFAEPQIDTRLIDNLIEGTPARSGTLDPEGGALEPGPELYFMLMRTLADNLKSCLAPPA
jgi:zinc transport system substrate-binding protein